MDNQDTKHNSAPARDLAGRRVATGGTATRDLAGRRVVVTGGTAGLGRALVDELTARGAQVGFVARGRSGVTDTERAVPGSVGVVADVSRQDDIHPAALQLTGRLGGVDVLINNASSLGPVPLRPLA
ncbi:MAG: SDR family oxidoreductase, partial [Myxococcales bacterium]